jgi:DNA modification methylase
MTEHRIIQGDAAKVLETLESGSIQCGVTSCPYDNARTYEQENLEWDFKKIAKELYRILCLGGVLCWNVNDMTVNGSETRQISKSKERSARWACLKKKSRPQLRTAWHVPSSWRGNNGVK